MMFEELQINLNLVFDVEDKMKILENTASRCKEGYFFVDDNDGECYLFDKNGNLDDIKKIKTLCEEHIKKDIKKIKIPTKVASIGNYAFFDCNSLTNVMIPDSITNIGRHAFVRCRSLTSVIIPNSVMSIGFDTFWSCKNVKELVFKGKTLKQVKDMKYYPFGIENKSIIKVE